eukprot:scaffold90632_cov17-Tisochrysis_lutea.AAC.3
MSGKWLQQGGNLTARHAGDCVGKVEAAVYSLNRAQAMLVLMPATQKESADEVRQGLHAVHAYKGSSAKAKGCLFQEA